MTKNDACEIAYSNGYEQGLKDAVKHGRWEDGVCVHMHTGEKRKAQSCSVCDSRYFNYDLSSNTIADVPNYCPNCGAKMDGGKET